MKATDLLKQQHDEVKQLFEQIESAPRADSKRKLFEELAAKLVAHDGIERQLFYPACEERLGMNELLGEALVEHGLVEFCVFQADQALGKDDFEYKVTVLREALEHHIREEERELFPKVKKAFEREQLEELGNQLEEKFEQLVSEDFRAPLRSNLTQVLKGKLEPAPQRKAGARKAAKSPRGRSRAGAANQKRNPRGRKSRGTSRKAARRTQTA